MNRRTFLSALGALPFVGVLVGALVKARHEKDPNRLERCICGEPWCATCDEHGHAFDPTRCIVFDDETGAPHGRYYRGVELDYTEGLDRASRYRA